MKWLKVTVLAAVLTACVTTGQIGREFVDSATQTRFMYPGWFTVVGTDQSDVVAVVRSQTMSAARCRVLAEPDQSVADLQSHELRALNQRSHSIEDMLAILAYDMDSGDVSSYRRTRFGDGLEGGFVEAIGSSADFGGEFRVLVAATFIPAGYRLVVICSQPTSTLLWDGAPRPESTEAFDMITDTLSTAPQT